MVLFDLEHLRLVGIAHCVVFRLRIVQYRFKLRQLRRSEFQALLHFGDVPVAARIRCLDVGNVGDVVAMTQGTHRRPSAKQQRRKRRRCQLIPLHSEPPRAG